MSTAADRVELAARALEELSEPLTLVGREVVHHHHLLPTPKSRDENFLEVGLEDGPARRPFHCQARSHTLGRNTRR